MPTDNKEVLELTRMTKKGIAALCKKNKLYQTPQLNDVLYLHYQGYQDIDCLEEYTGLKTLWLENNAISAISGLENQKFLKCLFLHNNLIKKIENLDNCPELDTLNLSHNHISHIDKSGIEKLKSLTNLNISYNYLRTAESLEALTNCKMLSVLDLAHNRIEDILVVKIFAKMPELRVLVLEHNPVVTKIPQYRKTLILECEQLTYLDSRPVFPRDRACAEAWKRGGYEEERREHGRWNKADRRRIRESVNATLRLRNRGGGEPLVELLSSSEDEDDTRVERSSASYKEKEKEVAIESSLKKNEIGKIARTEFMGTKPAALLRKCPKCSRSDCTYQHIEATPRIQVSFEEIEDILEDTNLFQSEENGTENVFSDSFNGENRHKDDLHKKTEDNYQQTVETLLLLASKVQDAKILKGAEGNKIEPNESTVNTLATSEKKKHVRILITENHSTEEHVKIPTTPIQNRKGRKINWSRSQEQIKRSRIERGKDDFLDIFNDWISNPFKEEYCHALTVQYLANLAESKTAPLYDIPIFSTKLNYTSINSTAIAEVENSARVVNSSEDTQTEVTEKVSEAEKLHIEQDTIKQFENQKLKYFSINSISIAENENQTVASYSSEDNLRKTTEEVSAEKLQSEPDTVEELEEPKIKISSINYISIALGEDSELNVNSSEDTKIEAAEKVIEAEKLQFEQDTIEKFEDPKLNLSSVNSKAITDGKDLALAANSVEDTQNKTTGEVSAEILRSEQVTIDGLEDSKINHFSINSIPNVLGEDLEWEVDSLEDTQNEATEKVSEAEKLQSKQDTFEEFEYSKLNLSSINSIGIAKKEGLTCSTQNEATEEVSEAEKLQSEQDTFEEFEYSKLNLSSINSIGIAKEESLTCSEDTQSQTIEEVSEAENAQSEQDTIEEFGETLVLEGEDDKKSSTISGFLHSYDRFLESIEDRAKELSIRCTTGSFVEPEVDSLALSEVIDTFVEPTLHLSESPSLTAISSDYCTDEGRRKSEIIHRLLSSPFIKDTSSEKETNSLDSISKEMAEIQRNKEEKVLDMVNEIVKTVNSQKEKYEDTVEVIDNQLIIVRKDTVNKIANTGEMDKKNSFKVPISETIVEVAERIDQESLPASGVDIISDCETSPSNSSLNVFVDTSHDTVPSPYWDADDIGDDKDIQRIRESNTNFAAMLKQRYSGGIEDFPDSKEHSNAEDWPLEEKDLHIDSGRFSS